MERLKNFSTLHFSPSSIWDMLESVKSSRDSLKKPPVRLKANQVYIETLKHTFIPW